MTTTKTSDQVFNKDLQAMRKKEMVDSFMSGLLIGFLAGFCIMLAVITILHNANMARLGF